MLSSFRTAASSLVTMPAIGHRLDSRQRESSISQLLASEPKLLRCPRFGENARSCAGFRANHLNSLSNSNTAPLVLIYRLLIALLIEKTLYYIIYFFKISK